MKIAVDVQALQSQFSMHRGIGRYIASLLKNLLTIESNHEYVFYANAHLPEVVEIDGASATRYLEFPTPFALDQRANQHFLAHWAIATRIDAVMICSPLAESFNIVIPDIVCFPARVFTILYDIIPYLFPDRYLVNPAFEALYLERLNNVCAADLIMTISEASRIDAIHFLEIPEYKILNISAGVSNFFRPLFDDEKPVWVEYLLQKFQISKHFVLYAGGDDWRKNLPELIRAFAQLSAQLLEHHQLVIAGKLQPDTQSALQKLARQCGVTDHLILTGYISDEELRALYSLCAAFVFPSLYEGLGLPVIEAMACGAPVVAGHHSSLIEAGGEAAILVDVTITETLSGVLGSLLQDRQVATQLARLGLQQAKRFSWQTTAHRLAERLNKFV